MYQKNCFKPYIPWGEKDCNGWISRVRSIEWRFWDKIVSFSPVSDTFLKHRNLIGTAVLHWTVGCIKINFLSISLHHYLPPHLSPLLSPEFLMNPIVPSLPVMILEIIYLPGYQCNSLPNIFSLSSDSLSNIQALVQKEILCSYRDILSRSSNPNASHCKHRTATRWSLICLRFMWSHIWLRDHHL